MSLTDPRTLSELIIVSAKLSLEEFLGTLEAPYLVASGVLSATVNPARERSETGIMEIGGRVSHTPSESNPHAGLVFPVRKRRRAGDADGRISVGRSRDVDICIGDASVSHVHAHFEREGEATFIIDDGSRNGTFVNLARLEPQRRCPVDDEDVITFGRVSYQFFSPGALYMALRGFREGSV